ncbi:MAG: metal ABC transporter solute-binding protein, Zn/Mn family [Steroidobacteraceae bacterium]
MRAGLAGYVALAGGCAPQANHGAPMAIGVESQYANVLWQIGAPYVTVRAIETNPNTNPHDFEASPAVAREIARASLIVENGLGYDAWIKPLVAAAPKPGRRVLVVRRLLALPADTVNPHLWYDPRTMPAVARAAAAAFAAMDPAHAAYFAANARRFDASLAPWRAQIAAFRKRYAGTAVAVTEPVADLLLQAAGCRIRTPMALQLALMNGTDPAPQDVAAEQALLRDRSVKVFVYNQQVTDALTASLLQLARAEHIAVVGVYETMPQPGYDYQSWMLAETQALQAAVAHGLSTITLGR